MPTPGGGTGFDACVDRHSDDWREQLDEVTPDGIDVDFENVGGPIMDHVLGRLARSGAWPDLGVRHLHTTDDQPGLRNANQLLMQRATCGASSLPTTSTDTPRSSENSPRHWARARQLRRNRRRRLGNCIGETLNQALSGALEG